MTHYMRSMSRQSGSVASKLKCLARSPMLGWDPMAAQMEQG